MAAELASHADQAIAFGSLEIPLDIEPVGVEEMDIDQTNVPPSAETWAIDTPPLDLPPAPTTLTVQPELAVDLDNENDIESGQAEAEPTDDPLQFFEAPEDSKLETAAAIHSTASPTTAPKPKPATAEALASDEGPEFEDVREFLRKHVPHWTLEPE